MTVVYITIIALCVTVCDDVGKVWHACACTQNVFQVILTVFGGWAKHREPQLYIELAFAL